MTPIARLAKILTLAMAAAALAACAAAPTATPTPTVSRATATDVAGQPASVPPSNPSGPTAVIPTPTPTPPGFTPDPPFVPGCRTVTCDGQGEPFAGPGGGVRGRETGPPGVPTPNVPFPGAMPGPTCSPPGTATCDGQGRPIAGLGGGGAAPPPPVPSTTATAPGVSVIRPDVRVIPISSGGTNGLDVDVSTGLVYAVTNSTVGGWCGRPVGTRADLLSIVDPSAGKEVTAVPTGRGPVWPLVDSANGLVYVATSDGVVAVHEAGTGNRVASIEVGGLPHDLGLDPVSGLLVVSNTNDGSQRYVAVVDTKTRTVRAQLEVDRFPHRIMMDAARRVAYVISVESGTITTADTANPRVIGATPSGGKGTMWFSPALQRLYAPNRDASGPETIRVLDAEAAAFVGAVGPFLQNAGHQAFSIAVDDRRGLLYAALGDSSLVGVADARSLQPLAVFTAADCSWGVKLDEARRTGYVTGVTGGEVAAFSLDEVAAAVGR